MSNGGGIVSPYGDSVLIDSKASMDGVLAFLSVIRDGYMPRPYLDKNTAQVSAEFDAGRIAVWQETTSKLVYLERPAEMGGAGNTTATRNFAVALPPAGPAGRKLFIGGSNLGIFKTSKHQEAARKLVAFLTTDSAAIMQFCDVSGMAPARSSLYASAFYTRDANRKIFADLVASGQAYPAVPYWSELESSLLNARFANIFDIASEVNGPYSEEAVREELRALARDARALVAREIEAHPEHAKRLTALRATGGSP
jgi:multiple sugar transport system substrate-binding protein